MSAVSKWWGITVASVFLVVCGNEEAPQNLKPVPLSDAEFAVMIAEEGEKALQEANKKLDDLVAIVDEQRTFKNTVAAQDDIFNTLATTIWRWELMNYVHPNQEVRDAALELEEKESAWWVEVSMRKDLCDATKYYAEQLYPGEEETLDEQDARLLSFYLRDCRRRGFDLPQAQQDELKEIKEDLSLLKIDFSKNIKDDDSILSVPKADLDACMDSDFVATLESDPNAEEHYVLKPQYTHCYPILTRCSNPAIRRNVNVLLRNLGHKGGNLAVIEKIIELRQEMANLLGYDTFAEYQVETRMAQSPENVTNFLDMVATKLEPKAMGEWEQMQALKEQEIQEGIIDGESLVVQCEGNSNPNAPLGLPLCFYDYYYYQNQLSSTKYEVDEVLLAEYFPMEQVIDGVFGLMQELFDVRFEKAEPNLDQGDPLALWHHSVLFYRVHDIRSEQVLGSLYFDPFPRDNKYGHGAMFGLVSGKQLEDGYQHPVAALVVNFTEPTEDKPSLLKHNEVLTLAHEFGHALHHLVTQAKYMEFSGTSVPRDFVEAPSQMLEQWFWNADVLGTFAKHYETGEPIPAELLEAKIAAKNATTGVFYQRQMFYAQMDWTFHGGFGPYSPPAEGGTTATVNDLFAATMFYPHTNETTYETSFGHLTGYAAGYYSYMWAEVYAADMFQRFKADPMDEKVAWEYRQNILEVGDSVDLLGQVTDFLGREPNPDAFLESIGLN
jgi:thimet oligopeptidase